ncbi:tRNA uridine-5-carboxymethylaminomethyl(34) synthesis GTPase MnmE [Numidum massiliense]|uniref:tRNA uridine-5-carboxymethylaminomethyl(34) synthesis GTPase MnmE n=1 Tax=Numidum massiliense TaxID=1522315 RepID=UPI0006D57E09|nr:tRNA uridine-5-carboxymethylaminomethyl(34) synthesis GTPase MnmE [Numidum massiliense]
MLDTDTIAAVATPMGEGGIAIIRVSGAEAIAVVDCVFRGKQRLSTVDSHTIHYGHICATESGETLDEVMVTVMKSPKTFTREDVVEINCHGGVIPVKRVLEEVLRAGARLAEPGEFTKRAFLNGRIDLSQAEAVIDLIRAKTDRAAKQAVGQMEGKLSRMVQPLRQRILELLAAIEVNIDYPEYDAEQVTFELVLTAGEEIQAHIGRLLRTAEQGKILREGIQTAIIGRPNVGKSSLLNALVQENRAIVTDIPGTTRDVIEEYVNVRGVPLHLVDTAGIRKTEDVVERIGVERSERALEVADLLLVVVDSSAPLNAEDERLLTLTRERKGIVIANKMDLPQALSDADIKQYTGETTPLVHLSLRREEGIEELEKAVAALFFGGELAADDAVYVSNVRHIHLLEQALDSLQEALAAAGQEMPIDMVQIDLRRTWELLGEIIGDTVAEDLVDQLFSQFCLGK